MRRPGGLMPARLALSRLALSRLALAGLAALALGPVPASAAGPAARPARVVSLSVCVDQVLIPLADPGQVASVTYQAAEPAYSRVWRAAKRYYLNRGTAEEVIRLRPDLVFADPFNARATVRLLRRLGTRVVSLPNATTIPQIEAFVRRVAGLLGHPERGAAAIDRMRRRLAAIPAPDPARRPVLVMVWSRGYSPGAGTVADTAIRAAGFRNFTAMHGVVGMKQLALETLITAQVDALAITGTGDSGASIATEWLRHPALERLRASVPSIVLTGSLLSCGTPAITDAIERLARLRLRVEHRTGAR